LIATIYFALQILILEIKYSKSGMRIRIRIILGSLNRIRIRVKI
jgi:hypothetical protein